MTNEEKADLRELVKRGVSFMEIKECVDCSDTTIKRYMKIFTKNPKQEEIPDWGWND